MSKSSSKVIYSALSSYLINLGIINVGNAAVKLWENWLQVTSFIYVLPTID